MTTWGWAPPKPGRALPCTRRLLKKAGENFHERHHELIRGGVLLSFAKIFLPPLTRSVFMV